MALYRPCGCGKKSPKYKGHRDHHGSWYFDYYEGGRHGKHVRLNLGTEDRRTAEKLKGDMMKDADQGRDPSLRVIKARPWRSVCEEFIEKHVRVHVKSRSRANYERLVRRLITAFDGIDATGGHN